MSWRRPEPRCAICDRWYFPLYGYHVPSGWRWVDVCSKRCVDLALRDTPQFYWQHET